MGIEVNERTFYRPKPARQAKIRIGDHEPSDKLCAHTVLVLKPSDKEGIHIVVDASHHQYGFRESLDMLDSYEENKADMKGHPYDDRNLGSAAQRHAEGSHRTLFLKARAQITTSETNNAVMEQIKRLGGIESFWNTSPSDFGQVLKDDVVREALTKKRALLDQIEYNKGNNYEARLRELISESNGEGHQECFQSFHRYVANYLYDSESDC